MGDLLASQLIGRQVVVAPSEEIGVVYHHERREGLSPTLIWWVEWNSKPPSFHGTRELRIIDPAWAR